MRISAVATLAVAGAVTATATLWADAGTVAWEQHATITGDATVAAIAQPSAGTVQEAGMEVYVGGMQVSPDVLCGTIEVSKSRRQAIQRGSFTVALSEWGVGPLGSPFRALGSPTRLLEIAIYGCYRSDSTGTVYRYPLLVRGIVDSVGRESSGGGHIENYEVLDAGARWGRIPTTMILPAGHGLPTGRMVRKALTIAGETNFALEDGRRRYKEIQLVDADPIASSQEWLDVEGRSLYWDRNGNAVCPLLEPANYTGAVTLDEEKIIELSAESVVFPSDVVTDVTATGTEQVTSEDDSCAGMVTSPDHLISTFRTFAVDAWPQSQAGGCTLMDTGFSTTSTQQLFSLTITRQTTRCGVTVREESESWAWFSAEAARYYYLGGSKFCQGGVWVADSAVASDNAPAYTDRIAHWRLIGRTVKTYYYDAVGWLFVGLDATSDFATVASDPRAGEWLTALRGHLGGPGSTGAYLGSITDTFGFCNPLTAAKDQTDSPGDPWDLVPFRDVFTRGDGTAIRDEFEAFRLTAKTVETTQSSDTGYIEKTVQYNYAYAINPNGHQFLFSDGSLSGDANQQVLDIAIESNSYLPTVENQHQKVTVTELLGKSPVVVSENVAGAPPAVEYLPEWQPAQDTGFIGEEDATFAVSAVAGETRPIKVILSAPDLLTSHLPRSVKVSYPYAEDEEELAQAARRVIVESLLVSATVTLPANYLLDLNSPVNLTFRPLGIEALNTVCDSITHTDPIGGAKTSRVVLEAYPDQVSAMVAAMDA